MILIAAVIILGFVVLSFAQTNSQNYEYRYQETVNSDISKLKESVSFEYAYYNATTKNVLVYLLNSGDVAVTVNKAYLSSSPQNVAFSMYYKNGAACASHVLESGQEGYIVVNANLGSGYYQVKVVTERESNFAYDFIV
jgi:archaellum component FlaG (FlaF/FlaG flagellin family)